MKPGGMVVRQESKIIRMKIIETEKKEEAIVFSKSNNCLKLYKCKSQVPIENSQIS